MYANQLHIIIVTCLAIVISSKSTSTDEITAGHSSAYSVNAASESSCFSILDNLLKLSNGPLLNSAKEEEWFVKLHTSLAKSVCTEIKENINARLLTNKSVLVSTANRLLIKIDRMRRDDSNRVLRVCSNWEDIENLLKASYLIIIKLERNLWDAENAAFLNGAKPLYDNCAELLRRIPNIQIQQHLHTLYINAFSMLWVSATAFVNDIRPTNIDLFVGPAVATLNRICRSNQNSYNEYVQDVKSFYGALDIGLKCELYDFIHGTVLGYYWKLNNYSVPDCDEAEITNASKYVYASVTPLRSLMQILDSALRSQILDFEEISSLSDLKLTVGNLYRQFSANQDGLAKLKLYWRAMAEIEVLNINRDSK